MHILTWNVLCNFVNNGDTDTEPSQRGQWSIAVKSDIRAERVRVSTAVASRIAGLPTALLESSFSKSRKYSARAGSKLTPISPPNTIGFFLHFLTTSSRVRAASGRWTLSQKQYKQFSIFEKIGVPNPLILCMNFNCSRKTLFPEKDFNGHWLSSSNYWLFRYVEKRDKLVPLSIGKATVERKPSWKCKYKCRLMFLSVFFAGRPLRKF